MHLHNSIPDRAFYQDHIGQLTVMLDGRDVSDVCVAYDQTEGYVVCRDMILAPDANRPAHDPAGGLNVRRGKVDAVRFASQQRGDLHPVVVQLQAAERGGA